MSTTLHWAALAAYLAGTLVYLGFVIWQRRGLYSMGRAILWLGLAAHSAGLIAAWAESGVFPATTLRQSLDVFSWGIMGATLVINLRLKVMILGAITAPVCSLLLLAASVLPVGTVTTAPLLKSIWVPVHVLSILLGFGLLALTFFAGVLYLVQDRLIRSKNLGPVFKRMPPLSRLDELSQRSLVAGFVLMTVGLITGAIYAQQALGAYWRWDPKEVWALITWLLYAAQLHTRLVQGWRGRRGAWLSAAAFGALLFTYLGAGLLMPGYHSFASFANLPEPKP